MVCSACEPAVVADERPDQRAQPAAVGHERLDAALQQRLGGDRVRRRPSRRCRAARARRCWSVTPASSAASSQACAPGADVKTTASISPAATAAHRGLDHGRVRRRTPAVHDEAADPRTGGGERLVEPVRAGAVVLDGDVAAGDALVEQHLGDLGARLGLGDPVGGEPGGLDRAARLGSARDDPGAARASRTSGSSSPAASAASIQPRNPMPVVTTTVSGGSASSDRVPSSSAASSMCGTMLSAGACRTAAPRRPRAAASSADRRSAVMSTTRPARVWSMGSLTWPL